MIVVAVELANEAAFEVKTKGTAMTVAKQPANIRPNAMDIRALNRLIKLFKRKII